MSDFEGNQSESSQTNQPAQRPQYDSSNSVGMDVNTYNLLMHLSSLVFGFLGPLVMWLISKDKDPRIDEHGKEAVNFQISLILYYILCVIGFFLIVGIFLIFAVLAIQIIFTIIAAVKASNGESYRYPLTIRFIS